MRINMASDRKKKTVSEVYSELMHYTGASGLEGIIRTQTLWATNAAFLNDSSEIELFFNKRLVGVIEKGIRTELAASPELKITAVQDEDEDEAIVQYANDMANAIRQTARRFHLPYIASFSAPNNRTVSRDGLLSQWRGYGKEGGYAIVFDTKGIEELLASEADGYYYQSLQWGDVHYHNEDGEASNVEPEIIDAEDTLSSAIGAFIRNQSKTELEKTFEPIITLSCMFKHWGFHEEHEVRIVAIPPTPELISVLKEHGENHRPIRYPKTFIRSGVPVPYLNLFAQRDENPKPILPITRVIVGPHPQQELRKQAIQYLLESKCISAKVDVSRIPYIGA